MNTSIIPDLILHNGRITMLDPKYPEANNLAIKDGRIVGVDDAEEYQKGPNTKVIDLRSRRAIPGLNDSHLHVIRGGLNYNMELRWDGVPSLADGLRIAYNLFTQKPNHEKEDFAGWIKQAAPGKGAVGFPTKAARKARLLRASWRICLCSLTTIFQCPRKASRVSNPF